MDRNPFSPHLGLGVPTDRSPIRHKKPASAYMAGGQWGWWYATAGILGRGFGRLLCYRSISLGRCGPPETQNARSVAGQAHKSDFPHNPRAARKT